jgi:hypothetical protein
MEESLRRRVAGITGQEVVAWSRVERGYTPAGRWVVGLADGASVFVKVGTTPGAARGVRAEARCNAQLRGSFFPRMVALDDHPEPPLLVLEDLSGGHWPPPWEPGEPERLLETLRAVAATRPVPDGLPAPDRASLAGWTEVARDPDPFLALGLCSAGWLQTALPALLEAQAAAVLAGDDLVHFDVRSDNVCFLPDRVVLVDWNCALRGNGALDLAFLAPSLRLEGGPLPEEILPGGAALAAVVSGFFAARAGQPVIPDAPRVRWIQLRQLRMALPWAARALGLPPPDRSWPQREEARIEALFAAGQIDQGGWHERWEELIGDLYLSSDDPRAQSGKSGDEVDWRWSREPILDALPAGGCTILDVGCANGLLMESLHTWAAERGLIVEPYGLDISWRLAALARRRLPHWADRIWVGNVADWTPPRRFDLVATGIDYVTPPRRRALVDRLLREVVTPGGRLVLRPERVVPGVDDLVQQVQALGLQIGGVIDRPHPRGGEHRRTVWLDQRSRQNQ